MRFFPGEWKIRCEEHGYGSNVLPCPWPEHTQPLEFRVVEPTGQPEYWNDPGDPGIRPPTYKERRFARKAFVVGGNDWKVIAYGWEELK